MKTNNGKTILLSKCAICSSKKSGFTKKQEASRILSSLGLKTPLSKIPLLGDICFECNSIEVYKMNDIVNKYLLTDKFIPELHLKQPGFTYSACEPKISLRTKERIQKFKEKGDSKYIYKNDLDKVCFQYHMSYGVFKDLARRPVSDKVLRDKAFDVAKNPKYDGYQRGFASIVYKCFDKKTQGSGANNEIKQNEQLAEELHKPIIKKLEKRRVYSPFKDNIWLLI